ncbi:MAG: carboxypeptidase-like regulatory domain-containing protein [Lentimicrobium sp.]|nr:carboxypeptidase-like regulatory domain-containing protein [Lentimicrobium sp.]
MIKGTVYNLRGELLVGAHAHNISKSYGTFTDFSGTFSLIMAGKDSLKVSMVGYKPFFFRIPQNLNSLNYSLKITLLNDTLIITGPEIRPYPATYQDFRQEFITMRTPAEKIVKQMNLPTQPYRRKYENPDGGLLLPGPISLLYDNFSKEAKQKKKMAAIMSKTELRNKFLEIISAETLKIRYNCQSDEDIDNLLMTCGISKELLMSLPHYIIADRVDKCGKNWQQMNAKIVE